MKIECDKCGAKYSIADEKVRGKTFKIRCKKCSNVIIVRDKVAAVAASDGAGLEPEPAAASPGWHLAINGETVGPLGEDEVRQRFEAGEIDRDTAIWQEGFEDWIAVGDVDVFADLADARSGARPASSATDDPFASANQDDYAANAAAAASSAAAAAAMSGMSGMPSQGMSSPAAAQAPSSHRFEPEPQSPRVTKLTGQRNENSVLFSLDSLQALATGGPPAASPAPSRPGGAAAAEAKSNRGLATAAPSSEGSGLIDIRALGAMVGDEQRPAGPVAAPTRGVDETALPSFGGAGLGGLASTPLVPQAAPVEAAAMAAPPPARSNTPIYVMMAVLIVALVGLGAYVVLNEPEQLIVEKQVPVEQAPSVKGAAKDEESDEKKDDEDEDEPKDDEKAEEGEAADEKSDSKSPTKSSKRGTKSGSTKPSTKTSDATTTKTPTPATESGTKSNKGEDLDVDCILDPAKCGKGAKKPATSSGNNASADPSRPDVLSQTDIKAGIAPVKETAKACGPKHGAKPGEKVKVKLSIAGPSGTVTSASAEGAHQGTPLGNCVAAALKKAQFKPCNRQQFGVQYSVPF